MVDTSRVVEEHHGLLDSAESLTSRDAFLEEFCGDQPGHTFDTTYHEHDEV